MIALFDEPPRVTLRLDLYPVDTEAPVGLLMGVVYVPMSVNVSEQVLGLICLADGSVELVPNNAFTIDYRYDVETDRFSDLEAIRTEQEA